MKEPVLTASVVTGVIVAVLPIVLSLFARAKVTPTG